jgi:hypothetical protein
MMADDFFDGLANVTDVYSGNQVGDVTAASGRLVTRSRGEVFVFPRGLVHFQCSVGEVPAVAVCSF